jgi:NAD(P)H-binding
VRSLTTIGVIGATGTAGSRVVARLKARDVAVVEISRAHGAADLVSGRGLFQALAGVDVVIDVSNPMPDDRWSTIAQTLATATRNLVGTCAAQDIQRLVVSTLAGVEDPVFDGFPYYEAKRAAKKILLDSPVPATTPPSSPTTMTRCSSRTGGFSPSPPTRSPACSSRRPWDRTHPLRTITGPQTVRLPDLTARVLARQGDDRRVRGATPARPAGHRGAAGSRCRNSARPRRRHLATDPGTDRAAHQGRVQDLKRAARPGTKAWQPVPRVSAFSCRAKQRPLSSPQVEPTAARITSGV